MSWSQLQAKLRGDNEWTDIPTTHAQKDLALLISEMRGHGFRVDEIDRGAKVINPLTRNVECVYRIW